jgi:hypothetical protein
METSAALTEAQMTTARFRAAVESADLPAFLETLAADAVLRSPISLRAQFQGREAIAGLMPAVFDVIDDIRYFEDIGTEATRALFYRARVGGQTIEEATLVRLDEGARVTEMTLYIRPLPGLAALTAALGPRLVAENKGRAGVLAAMTRPLAAVTRFGDGLAVRLAQPRRR